MKIVDLKTFLSMPNGTVFLKYAPAYFEELCVKEENCSFGNDFIYSEINAPMDSSSSTEMMDLLFQAEETGESFPLDFDQTMRDGYFEESQLYAIYEKEDVEKLISKLNESLIKAYTEVK